MRALLLLPLLALAACADQGGAPRLKGEEVLLQVTASGRAETRPDEARVTVGVNNTAPTAAAASEANARIMQRLTEALGPLGVKADDLQTRNLSVQRIDWGPQRGQFRAENLIEVKVRDVSRAGAVVAAVTQVGGNVVAGPELRIGDPEKGDNAAYAAAFKAARARADAYAGAAGLKVGRVLAIRDGGVYGPPMPYEQDGHMAMRANAEAVQAAPPVHAGVDTRQVSIRVDFALTR
ncbi:MAG TPA: SIMPL domain-containing protein [Caulobacter sp.]|nr:SIMPL domain-containing protein [Caulobacter sp.]